MERGQHNPRHHGDPSLCVPHCAYADPGRLTGLRNRHPNTKGEEMNQFFQLLKKDHEKVKGILATLQETTESAPKKRDALSQSSEQSWCLT
jgi:hypothetical protein